MRLPRMTTRRWMVAVAVVGCLFSLVGLTPKASRMRARAAFHAREERWAHYLFTDEELWKAVIDQANRDSTQLPTDGLGRPERIKLNRTRTVCNRSTAWAWNPSPCRPPGLPEVRLPDVSVVCPPVRTSSVRVTGPAGLLVRRHQG
jgi:hypothetical protein